MLTQRWGAALPPSLRRGTAWVGGVFGLANWALYTTYCALRVAGVVGYPGDGDLTGQQMRNFDWANLGYFELWFGIMGVPAHRVRATKQGAGSTSPRCRSESPGDLACEARHRAEPDGHRSRRVGRVHLPPMGFAGPAVPGAGLATILNCTSGNRERSDR